MMQLNEILTANKSVSISWIKGDRERGRQRERERDKENAGGRQERNVCMWGEGGQRRERARERMKETLWSSHTMNRQWFKSFDHKSRIEKIAGNIHQVNKSTRIKVVIAKLSSTSKKQLYHCSSLTLCDSKAVKKNWLLTMYFIKECVFVEIKVKNRVL